MFQFGCGSPTDRSWLSGKALASHSEGCEFKSDSRLSFSSVSVGKYYDGTLKLCHQVYRLGPKIDRDLQFWCKDQITNFIDLALAFLSCHDHTDTHSHTET
jgi:hypothetical protein